MDDITDEAMQVAETAARLTFGTKLKRVPKVIFGKITLPVISVVAIVAFIFGATIDVLGKWKLTEGSDDESVTSTFHWSLQTHQNVLTVLTTLGMSMYLCCVYRDPGSVPVGYGPDHESVHSHSVGAHLVERKRKGGSRFCKKCVRHKPPRAHHCRQCNKCVLRMDHHCVWVNNCIGHRNYKSFFLFLLYITCACWHASYLLAWHVWSIGDSSTSPVGVAEVFSLTLCVPLTISLSVLFAWHCYLVSNNKTTIEHYEGVRSSSLLEGHLAPLHSTPKNDHPYSLGLRANLREILGPRIVCWLLPGCSIHGDGLVFANVGEYGKWRAAKTKKEDELTLLGE